MSRVFSRVDIFLALLGFPICAGSEPVRIDFGNGPVAEGYEPADRQTRYTRSLGYGWTKSPDGIRDRGIPGPLERDFIFSRTPATFRVDVEPGTYRVTLVAGDAHYGDHVLNVSTNADGDLPTDLHPEKGTFITATFSVETSSGELIFDFDSPVNNWALNALTVESTDESQEPTTTKETIDRNEIARSMEDTWLDVFAMPDPTIELLTTFRKDIHSFGNFKPTGLASENYLDLIEGNVDYFKRWQNKDGAIIDPYLHREFQYATPCFALSAATLIAHRDRNDLIESAAMAMDWALLTLKEGRAADNHGDFFSPQIAHALPLLKPHISDERYQHWEQLVRDIDPFESYRAGMGGGNWNVVALSGEALYHQMGLRDNDAFIEGSLRAQGRFFSSPWGLYIEGPMPYDHFPRIWAADMLASGYRGENTEKLSEILRRGAITSIFMQSPSGELPAGGRSAHHQWNEAEQCLTYEIYAARALEEGDEELARVFKRSAHLALESMQRWQRDSGELWILKNRVDPNHGHGYEGYSSHSQYNLLAMAMLSIAYEHSSPTEHLEELPAPADVGGFVFLIPDRHHKVFANAGGHYIEIDYNADLSHDSTGLIRVHRKGMYPALGPSQSLSEYSVHRYPKETRVTAAIGPAWKVNGDWRALASYGSGSHALGEIEMELRNVSITPTHVRFDLSYQQDFGGPSEIIMHYNVTPTLVEIKPELENYDGPLRMQWPVLANDGGSQTMVEISGDSVSASLYGSTQTWSAPGASNIVVGETQYSFRNGWAYLAVAEFESGTKAQLVIGNQ